MQKFSPKNQPQVSDTPHPVFPTVKIWVIPVWIQTSTGTLQHGENLESALKNKLFVHDIYLVENACLISLKNFEIKCLNIKITIYFSCSRAEKVKSRLLFKLHADFLQSFLIYNNFFAVGIPFENLLSLIYLLDF